MYVSTGELMIAHPTTRRLYIATIVACSGTCCKESLTTKGKNSSASILRSMIDTNHLFRTKTSDAIGRELVVSVPPSTSDTLWARRIPDLRPCLGCPASAFVYHRKPWDHYIQFQCVMSTDVLHEIHPRGPRFPVSGNHGRTTIDKAVQARQE